MATIFEITKTKERFTEYISGFTSDRLYRLKYSHTGSREKDNWKITRVTEGKMKTKT